MFVYVIGVAAVLVFAVAFYYSKLVPVCRDAISRAETTSLLEVINYSPGLATHLYRDVPLVQAPILWERKMGNSPLNIWK